MSKDVLNLNIRTIFFEDDNKYIIPIYQRNYAWTYKQISQLIRDVADYRLKNNDHYYIGTLVTYKKGECLYEVIDGQQRLTTLTLLLDVLKANNNKIDFFKYKNILAFESRKDSSDTLDMFYTKPLANVEEYKTEIVNGFKDCKKALKTILKEVQLTEEDFFNYLFEKVIIFRVEVPADTDLNHYFEIMNNRGEQLEKHEILKSYFLDAFVDDNTQDKDSSYAFSQIWEKCEVMEEYIQMQFDTDSSKPEKDIRSKIFGTDTTKETRWNHLQNQEKVFDALRIPPELTTDSSDEPSIKDVYDNPLAFDFGLVNPDSNKKKTRFNSVVTFPNFLLIVLRIYTQNNSIALDDKNLIDNFKKYTDKKDSEFSKGFIYCLLRCKYLFDKYIIKRDNTTDSWSLKRLYMTSESTNYKMVFSYSEQEEDDDDTELANIGKRITQILSMFHVSQPSQGYKYWIYAALKYLYYDENKNIRQEESINAKEYLSFLEELAKAYFFDRYVSAKPSNFDTIIDDNNCVSKNNAYQLHNLTYDAEVENFVFNYLDYLLWVDYISPERKYFGKKVKNENGSELVLPTIDDGNIRKYEFGFHSSVEHYYPQHPIDNPDVTVPNVDNFGNLCLISGSKNSRLSNHLPLAKKDFYIHAGIDSIKQRVMMEYKTWSENEIDEHGFIMEQILLEQKRTDTKFY